MLEMKETRSSATYDLVQLENELRHSDPRRKHINLEWITRQLRLAFNLDGSIDASAATLLGKRKTHPTDSIELPHVKRRQPPLEPPPPSSNGVWVHVVELGLKRDMHHNWTSNGNQIFQKQEDDFNSALKLLGKSTEADVLIGFGHVRCLSEARAGIYLTYVQFSASLILA